MSVEQVARDVVMNMTKIEKVKTMVTADAMASGGLLQQEIPITESLKVTAGLMTAFPDFKIDIQKLTVDGDRAWVKVRWSGTQTGPLSLPGMQAIPATKKKVSVEDAYVVTVRGDKVSHFEIQKLTVDGDRASVKVRWSGTQTGPLSLPGMPTIPATGKKVSVEDGYVVTVRGDKVSHFEIQSPADGGIPAAIAQLGVKVPVS
jgi:predicted ester cyclase